MVELKSDYEISHEGLSCRVCRGKGTEDSPLFYPCRCAGSIKYVHQECLVEWLKVSKKSYCEVCHYKFSFTPIYEEGSPNKLPMRLVIGYVARKTASTLGSVLSKVLLSALWFVALPLISGYVFDFYFQRSKEVSQPAIKTVVSELYNAVIAYNIGLIMQVSIIAIFLSLMLLRDYIVCTADADEEVQQERKRTLAKRSKAREAANAGIATLESSGDQPPLDSLTNTITVKPSLQSDGIRPAIISRRRVEVGKEVASAAESPSSSKNDGRWINQITNREYRAFLKRRELLRQKEKIFEFGSQGTEWEDHLDETRNGENIDDDLESIISGGTTSRASTKNSGISEMRRRNIVKLDFANSPIRCRICSSNCCVDREHVVQASNLSLNQQHKYEEPPSIQEEQLPLRSVPRPKNALFNYCLFLEQDSGEAFDSLMDTLGYSSGLKRGVINWFLALGANALFFHTFLYIPFILSIFVFNGAAITSIGTAFNFVFASAISNLRELLSGYRAITHFSNAVSVTSFMIRSLSSAASHSQLSQVLSGQVALYSIISFVAKNTLSRHSEKSLIIYHVHQWLSFSTCLYKAALTGTIEFLLLPAASFIFAIAHMKLIYDTTTIEKFAMSQSYFSALVCILAGLGLKELGKHVFERIRSLLRPGALFLAYSLLPESKVTVRKILDEGIVRSFLRISVKLLASVLMLGSTLSVPTLMLRYLLGKNHKLTVESIEEVEDWALHSAILLGLRGLLLVALFKIGIALIGGLLQRYAKYLRLRSVLFGGRFIPDESGIKKGTCFWMFAPDQDKSYKLSRVHRMASVEVEPIDIARLAIKESQKSKPDYEDQTAPREGGSRFKGYSVIFCPSHVVTRLALLGAAIIVCLQSFLLTMAWGPIAIGNAIAIFIPETASMDFTVRIIHISTYDLGLVALTILALSLVRIVELLNTCSFAVHSTRIVNFTKKVICGASLIIGLPIILGTWMNLVASPFITQYDEIPQVTPISIFCSGILALYSIIWARTALSKEFRHYMQHGITSSSFSVFSFIQQMILPILVPATLAIILPPLSVLLVAPIVEMEMSSVINAQKQSFSYFLILPGVFLSLRLAYRAHQSMLTKIRDDNYLVGLKVQNYSNVPL